MKIRLGDARSRRLDAVSGRAHERRGAWCARAAAIVATACLALAAASTASADGGEDATLLTTAWHDGALQVDTAGVVGRSDLVLDGPAWRRYQAMPLGNGTLGAAVWNEEGFTAQLNRVDLFPDLKSPGQLVIPGLDRMARAEDYQGRLDLFDGTLVQSGGGITARTWVQAGGDRLVVDVTGADPAKEQTAELRLWDGRDPETYAGGGVGALAETFTDDRSGQRSGAVAAVTAAGRDVVAGTDGELTARVRFRPDADGHYRVVVGVPFFTGGDLADAAQRAVRVDEESPAAAQRRWWHRFWRSVAPLKLTSADGSAEYLESLRNLELYSSASSMRGRFPASHGAVINAFSAFRDSADWYPSGFWHFNLRMQTAANLAANTAWLNAPFFRLYRDNLDNLRAWTREHMPGTEGVCIPETVRFDGTGFYPGDSQCDAAQGPNYVAKILSTGPEVALEAWKQYRYTGDERFLAHQYPLMADVVRFYLSYAKEGADGYLHLEHVNALENQWDTADPATDLAAMRVLFPLVADLAARRGDAALAARLRAAIPKIPPFRIVQRNGEDVIAWSGTDEPTKNFQNPDMEPVWPWGLFGDRGGPGTELALSTFRNRVFPQRYDWGMDATWAARLGLSEEIPALLVEGTKQFQIFPNGFGFFAQGGNPSTAQSFYQEWNGVVATGLHEALVQAYDGLLRVPAAWPSGWDVQGALQIQGGHRVSVEVRDGVTQLVGIQAARREVLHLRNPWPGREVRVVDGRTGRGEPIVAPTAADEVSIPVEPGRSYLVERTEVPYPSFAFQPVTGTPATSVRHLGTRTLGVEKSDPPPACVVPPSDRPLVDWDPESGDRIVDASPDHHDASIVGGGLYTDGPDGPALVLDGNRFVQTEAPTTLGRLSNGATFISQVRVRGSGSYRRLWDSIPVGNNGSDGFLVDLTPDNHIRFIGAAQLEVTDAVLPTDRWVTLAVTFGADGRLSVYIDGALAASKALTARPINGCIQLKLQFGVDQSGGSRLVGDVDDMQIWGRALTASEIGAL